MSKTIKQDGKTYEQHAYVHGAQIQAGAMLDVNGRLQPSGCIGQPCGGGEMQGAYFHEVEPEPDLCPACEGCLQVPDGDGAYLMCHCTAAKPGPVMVAFEVELNSSDQEICDAFRVALAARRTKLEEWREGLHLPWWRDGEYRISDSQRRDSEGFPTIGEMEGRTAWQAKLMAAAPLLAEALLSGVERHRRDAIKAAFPEDVAAEILGE